jgi:hypothetical protein
MALQGSGAISLSQIASEFGGSAPHSLSEYYRGGSNVPSSVTRDADASSLSISSLTHINRGSTYTTTPRINSTNLYTHRLWADNGSTGVSDCTFYVNQTGTYNYRFYLYDTSNRGGTFKIYVNGVLQYTWTTSSSSGGVSYTSSVTASAGQSIRVYSTWGSSGWGGSYIDVGGSSYSNDDVVLSANQSVPTSGAVSFDDYYNGTKT